MKILNVLNFFDKDTGGGIANRVYEMTTYFDSKGITCDVLTTNIGKNIYKFSEKSKSKIFFMESLLNRFFIPKKANSWFKENISNYDIIHLSGNWSILCVIAYFYAKKKKKKIIFSAMGWLSIQGRSKLIKLIFTNLFTKRIIKNADFLVAISPREISDYIENGGKKNKIKLIPNGVSLENFVENDEALFREKFNLDNRKIILFIGRICEIKGIDILIESIGRISHKISEYQLCIFGQDDNGFIHKISNSINRLKLDNMIHVFPPILGRDKSLAYSASDFIVIPSRYDTMTIVALEAGASKCPVIYSKECDFDDLELNRAGLKVNPTVESLSEAILKLANNQYIKDQMSNNIYELVTHSYTWQNVGETFYDLLVNLDEKIEDIENL